MERRDFVEHVAKAAAAASLVSAVPKSAFAAPWKIKVAGVGDCIITRPVSKITDQRFLDLVGILRTADALYGNCELNLVDGTKAYPDPKWDMNLFCEPWGADELAWMGFKLMGTANNHTMDYGREGMFSTLENLQRVGIAAAGTGRNLEEASRPAFTSTPGGRVGLVNYSSHFAAWWIATHAHPPIPGRPGLNPLRTERRFQVERESFDHLKAVAQRMAAAYERTSYPASVASGFLRGRPAPNASELTFLDNRFVVGPKAEMLMTANEADVERITSAVKIAKRQAQVAIVSTHERQSTNDEIPAPFLPGFAKACIDAGADVFFGSGTHLARGIEIYKGKPIFYDLGNFFFQIHTLRHVPSEVFEAMGLSKHTEDPYEKTKTMYYEEKDRVRWESFVPVITYEDGQMVNLELHPIVLGFKEPPAFMGTPGLANPEEGATILARVARLSEAFGTRISVRNGIGVVALGAE